MSLRSTRLHRIYKSIHFYICQADCLAFILSFLNTDDGSIVFLRITGVIFIDIVKLLILKVSLAISLTLIELKVR